MIILPNQAVTELSQGKVVALPTETVYGLAADASNDKAVAQIFATKQRPSFNPLILHVSSLDQARQIACFTAEAEALAQAFWPGPLTLVLPRQTATPVSLLACAGLPTLAVRMPAHPLFLEIIEKLGKPLAAPSANLSGRLSPTCPEHVMKDFGDTIHIVDGGQARIGLESTIIDLSVSPAVVLRPGAITTEELEQILQEKVGQSKGPVLSPKAPGQLTHHYAPRCPLRLNVTRPEADEALLAFGEDIPPAEKVLNLSPRGDLLEAASNLFKMLHLLDQPPTIKIAVMPIPQKGIGVAINDRLQRAATPQNKKNDFI